MLTHLVQTILSRVSSGHRGCDNVIKVDVVATQEAGDANIHPAVLQQEVVVCLSVEQLSCCG